MNRRKFIGILSTGSLAGCVSRLSGRNETGFPLGSLMIRNQRDKPVTINIRIFEKDKHWVVYEREHEINGGEDQFIHPSSNETQHWSSDPGVYMIDYVIQNSEANWQTYQAVRRPDWMEGECIYIIIDIKSDRTLAYTYDSEWLEEGRCN